MTRTLFTTVTPLPANIPRRLVLDTLHDHLGMIDLNPTGESRFRMEKPPPKASPEEYHAAWYSMTDKISYLPGVKGKVTYFGCFNDLRNGLQTTVYAPMGLIIKDKWTVGGNEPGEPREPQELGIKAPKDGLYLREDIDFTCNMMLSSFVKKNLVNAHQVLVDRLIEKAKLEETREYNSQIDARSTAASSSPRQQFAEFGSPRQQYSTVGPSPSGGDSRTQSMYQPLSHQQTWPAQQQHPTSPPPHGQDQYGFPQDRKYTYDQQQQQQQQQQQHLNHPHSFNAELPAPHHRAPAEPHPSRHPAFVAELPHTEPVPKVAELE